MARRSGSADLPLHSGRVPPWLASRMARLGTVITEAIVHHYGREEFLRRLAHPYWFQSFGAVMGMDWHSSGITTAVIGALKRGLTPRAKELGLHVCGGRGSHSRERTGFDGAALAKASRLVAKVDSAAVQDGFDLYLHGFIVTDDGQWVVVQQGMNGESKLARRYHWLSHDLKSFVETPHSAIDGENQGEIVNLTDVRAKASRDGQLELLQEFGPDRIVRELTALKGLSASVEAEPMLPHLIMPAHHDVRPKDVMMRRLHARSPRRPMPARPTSPTCCWCRASGRARCIHWRWSPKSCMARRTALPTRRASRSRTAARTATPIRCRPRCSTRRSAC
jgi:hypothetical protein